MSNGPSAKRIFRFVLLGLGIVLIAFGAYALIYGLLT